MKNSSSQAEQPDFYSVERRFDLTTIFVVTSACALLYGFCAAASVPATLPTAMVLYISVVGLGQAFLFGGNKPRLASTLVGLVVFAGFITIVNSMGPRMVVDRLVFQALISTPFGCLFGYCAGTAAAGTFFVAAKIRGKRDANSEPDEEPSFDDLGT